MAKVATGSLIIISFLVCACSTVAFRKGKYKKKVEGGWSSFGPWSTCSNLCGQGGIQRRTRKCQNPWGKDCAGQAQEERSCNSTNCPDPCSFDGALIQLLNFIDPNTRITNHLVDAFSQVYDAMETSRSLDSKISNHQIINTIKALLLKNSESNVQRARSLLGVLLARQPSCNYVDIAERLQDAITTEGYKKLINAYSSISLVFVMDNSRNMKPVILEVTKIVKRIGKHRSTDYIDFILSTFSGGRGDDKLMGDVKTFSGLDQFVSALEKTSRKLDRAGNKLQNKQTYAGIIRGIYEGQPKQGSPMFVFTDDSPQSFKSYTKENAIYHAVKNKIPVTFFVTGPNHITSISEYRDISRATGGLALSYKKKALLRTFQGLINGSLDGTSTIGSGISTNATTHDLDISKEKIAVKLPEDSFSIGSRSTIGRQNYKKGKNRDVRIFDDGFTIDDIAQEGTIDVSVTRRDGLETSGEDPVELYNPRNELRPHERFLEGGNFIWTILRPLSGDWSFRSERTVPCENIQVKSHASLDIEFTLRFERNGNKIEHPLIGEKAYVVLVVPNLSRLDDTSLTLTSDVYTFLPVEGLIHTYETSTEIAPAPEGIKINLVGKTLSQFNFTREKEGIQPKSAALRPMVFYVPKNEEFTYDVFIEYAGGSSKVYNIEMTVDGEEVMDERLEVNNPGEKVSAELMALSRSFPITIKLTSIDDEEEINFDQNIIVF